MHAGDCRTGLLLTGGTPASLLRWPRVVLFSCVVDEQKQSSDVDVDKHINMLQATVPRVQFHDRGVAEFVELSRDVLVG